MSASQEPTQAIDPAVDPARLGIFASLAPELWSELVAHMEIKRFRPGDVLIKQGAVDRGMYIVRQGTLAVLVSGKDGERVRRVGTIGAGSVVGEQALLDGKPRSATITALDDAELLRLSFESFRALQQSAPHLAGIFLFELARVISLRFRSAQQDEGEDEGAAPA